LETGKRFLLLSSQRKRKKSGWFFRKVEISGELKGGSRLLKLGIL
jgi:hypothetical protein